MVSERSQKRLFTLIFALKFSFLPSYSQKLTPPTVYGVDDATFTSKGTMMMAFDDEIFLSFVEQLTVLSRKEVVFDLKCGLSLRERLVEL